MARGPEVREDGARGLAAPLPRAAGCGFAEEQRLGPLGLRGASILGAGCGWGWAWATEGCSECRRTGSPRVPSVAPDELAVFSLYDRAPLLAALLAGSLRGL